MHNLAERHEPVAQPLTREEAADILRVSIRTVDRMIADGVIKKLQLGGRLVRITRSSVDALLQERAS